VIAFGRRAFILAMLALSLTATPALADCDDARQQYNVAVEQIHDAVRTYLRCVAASQGSDDCSNEFRRVQNAHEDLETAVGEVEAECNSE
jgi:hypothetical protein